MTFCSAYTKFIIIFKVIDYAKDTHTFGSGYL